LDPTVNLIGSVTNVCISTQSDPNWTVDGAYMTLNKGTPSSVFTASDCDKTQWGSTPQTVSGVAYDVGSSTPQFMESLPEGTAIVSAPGGGAWLVNHAYMIMPGGRGGAKNFQVTFNYADGTSFPTSNVVIPWDCNGGGPINGTDVTLINEGGYSAIGGNNCCNSWWEGTFTNPNPSKQVTSLSVYYQAAGGWNNGRVWAVTID
jgi:hypothetical protein